MTAKWQSMFKIGKCEVDAKAEASQIEVNLEKKP